MGYCEKGHAAEFRFDGIDATNAVFQECRACGEVWLLRTPSPEWAAAFRTALACGRSWERAYRMADEYPTHASERGVTYARKGGEPAPHTQRPERAT